MFGSHRSHSREIPPRRSDLRPAHPYIANMVRLHPHAEAIYKVVPLVDGTFGVEVVVPETYPTHIRGFATEAEAGAWITAHKVHVELNLPYRRTRPRSSSS